MVLLFLAFGEGGGFDVQGSEFSALETGIGFRVEGSGASAFSRWIPTVGKVLYSLMDKGLGFFRVWGFGFEGAFIP